MHGAIMCTEVILYVGLTNPPLFLSLSLALSLKARAEGAPPKRRLCRQQPQGDPRSLPEPDGCRGNAWS